MRIARFALALAVMALPTLLVATPAHADGVNLTVTSATWTPQIGSVQSAASEWVRLTLPNMGIKIHVTTTVPGGVYASYNAGGGIYCTADSDSSFTCVTTASPSGDPAGIQLFYHSSPIIRALGEKASADYTTTATVVGTGETATSQYHVRPKADWQIGYTNIQGLSSTEFEIMTNALSRGPSGGSAAMTVTGFRTRSPKPLPAGCKWSGALAVTCKYSGDASQDLTSVAEIPIVAGERGCSYQIKVAGVYPDPKPSNNSKTVRGSGPCGSSGTSTATPTPKPTTTNAGGSGGTASGGTGSGSTSTPAPSPVASVSSAPTATATPVASTPVASTTGDVVAAAQSPMALAASSRTSGGSGHTGLIVGLAGALLVAAGAGGLFWIRRRTADTGTV